MSAEQALSPGHLPARGCKSTLIPRKDGWEPEPHDGGLTLVLRSLAVGLWAVTEQLCFSVKQSFTVQGHREDWLRLSREWTESCPPACPQTSLILTSVLARGPPSPHRTACPGRSQAEVGRLEGLGPDWGLRSSEEETQAQWSLRPQPRAPGRPRGARCVSAQRPSRTLCSLHLRAQRGSWAWPVCWGDRLRVQTARGHLFQGEPLPGPRPSPARAARGL